MSVSRLALAMGLVLSGCQAAVPASAVGPAAVIQGEAAPSWTLPFTTLVDEMGDGRFAAAGASVHRVIRTKAEWDAFVAGLAPAVVPRGAQPSELALPPVDFAARQLIAFVDGAPPLAATSRIVAIEDQGAGLLVRTQRWEAPPNPNAGPDANARLHVVALPRTDRPIAFAPLAIADGAARPGEGGYGAAGSPLMHPRWRAVPNPDVSLAMIDASVRRQYEGQPVTRLVVERRTIAEASGLLGRPGELAGNFTPESEVFVVIVEGDLAPGGIGPGGGGTVSAFGGTPDRFSAVTTLIDIERGHAFTSMAKPGRPGKPGMRLMLPQKDTWYVGDALTASASGPLPEGEATLTIDGEAPEQRWSKAIAMKDLATFTLALDTAHVPWLADVEVQKVIVNLRFPMGGTGFETLLVRDRDTGPVPAMRSAAGTSWEPGTAPPPVPSEEELAAWARAIGVDDWKGTGVTITGAPVAIAGLGLAPERSAFLPADAQARRFELRGTFPKVVVPANYSGTGKAEAMAPRRLVVVVAAHFSKEVLDFKAYPD